MSAPCRQRDLYCAYTGRAVAEQGQDLCGEIGIL